MEGLGAIEAGGDRPRVLVVGDDRLLLGLVRRSLPGERYALIAAETVERGLDALFTHRPDLVLVISRPDGADGTASCQELQAVEDVPVILVAPSADTLGAVRGLTCADDYVALPVAPEELEARARAVLRRAGPRRGGVEPIYDDGRLRVDLQNRRVSLGGGPLRLTPTEYRLLALLVSNPRRVLTYDELLRRVWGSAYAGDSHLLRLHVSNLRRKIERPSGPRYIRTHRSLGYAFQPPPGRA